MIPVFGDTINTDDSQKRLSNYLGRLFAEGEMLDVIAFSQHELEVHPLNLDMIVYRACAILVMQVSGAMKKNEGLVEQAIDHLEFSVNFIRGALMDYDDSLNFYIALGYLVLDKIDLADSTLQLISNQMDADPEAFNYYTSRREYWLSKRMFPFRHLYSVGRHLS